MPAFEHAHPDLHFAVLSEIKAQWVGTLNWLHFLQDKALPLLIKCIDTVIARKHPLVSDENTTGFPEANCSLVALSLFHQEP